MQVPGTHLEGAWDWESYSQTSWMSLPYYLLTRLSYRQEINVPRTDFNLKPNLATAFTPFFYCYFFWYSIHPNAPISAHLGLVKSQDAVLRHCPPGPSLTFCKKKQTFYTSASPIRLPITPGVQGYYQTDLCSLSKVVLKKGTYMPGGVPHFPRPQVCTVHIRLS